MYSSFLVGEVGVGVGKSYSSKLESGDLSMVMMVSSGLLPRITVLVKRAY